MPRGNLLVIVEGVGTRWLNGKKQPAKRGDIFYAAPWGYHGLGNTDASPTSSRDAG
jgi:quercetin dioxygenase-like cupin family protein